MVSSKALLPAAAAAATALYAASWLRRHGWRAARQQPQLLLTALRDLWSSEPLEYSFHDFMDDSLSHPAWGYYSSGRVGFGESRLAADFTTFPISMRPFFGAILADRLHSLWLATAAKPGDGDAGGGKETFVVVELGAGTGVLAHDVLLRIRDAWPTMYAELLYVIGERSASLRDVQLATNARFVADSKLAVVSADAREMRGEVRRLLQRGGGGAAAATVVGGGGVAAVGMRGAIISNELPDAFPVEKVLVGRAAGGSGGAALRLQRGYVLPLVRRADLEQILGSCRGAPGGGAPGGGAPGRGAPLPRLLLLLLRSRRARARLAAAAAAGAVELGLGDRGEQMLRGGAQALRAFASGARGEEAGGGGGGGGGAGGAGGASGAGGAGGGAGGEWVLLSRADYCALKARSLMGLEVRVRLGLGIDL